jgi:hypothetical protein
MGATAIVMANGKSQINNLLLRGNPITTKSMTHRGAKKEAVLKYKNNRYSSG